MSLMVGICCRRNAMIILIKMMAVLGTAILPMVIKCAVCCAMYFARCHVRFGTMYILDLL